MFTMPRALPRQVTSPIVSVLAAIGVTPNMLTFAQLVGGIIAGGLLAAGYFIEGAIVMLAAATLDAIDGTLARTTGKVTRFGGVFDSVLDRLFEGAVLGGLLWFYFGQGAREEAMLVFVAAVGSLCVSYVRARAEVEGVTMYDGIFTRAVRIVVLAAGLFLGLMRPVLWLLAVMTLVTTLQRLYIAWSRLKGAEAQEADA